MNNQTYTKKQFGSELKRLIDSGVNSDSIAKWAFQIYLEKGLIFEDGLDDHVLRLVAMDQSESFLLSEGEINSLANFLVN